MDTSKSVVARAPLRLSFAGGGTDVDAFSHRYGGYVLSAAIARYVTVRMRPTGGILTSYPLDETDTSYLAACAKAARMPEASLESRVDAPPRSGLGASGALCVAALKVFNDPNLGPPTGVAGLAHLVETTLGVESGRQDYQPALMGGVVALDFRDIAVGKYVVAPPDALSTLESALIMVFIHSRTGSSSRVMEDEVRRIRDGDLATVIALKRQAEIARDMERALCQGHLRAFGDLLHEAWRTKRQQSPECTNDVIDAVYNIALKAGALGGKLSGAGGGGYMFFFAPGKEGPVAEALRTVGLRPENVVFDWKGCQVWSEKNQS